MVKLAAFAAAIALLGQALAAPAGADTPEPQGWAYEMSGELMSPFCPGSTLADCPSPAAASLRMWIVVQEAAGRARAEVEAELYARYGDQIRPAPRAEGFGLTAYLVPLAVFAGGGLLVGVVLRRMTRREPLAAAPALPADPELERLVDEELAG